MTTTSASVPGRPLLMKILASAAYFWLVMVVYYILKPVRDSLFLGERGIRDLPIAHLLNLGATLACVQAYVALSRRVSRRWFVIGVNLFFITGLLGFWAVLGPLAAAPEVRKILAWVYFTFVSAFSVFEVSLLWSLTHSTFTPDEGKHWYGWIGSGGTLGALTGGFLTNSLARELGTTNLLLLALAAFLPCMALGWLLGGRADDAERQREEAARHPSGTMPEPAPLNVSATTTQPVSAWTMLLANPYLALIGLLVFIKLFVGLTQDYQSQEVISRAFTTDPDGRTQFFGSIYQWTNVLGLFLGLVVTGPVQTRWGAFPGLATYPVSAFIGGLALIAWPGLTTVFWLSVISQATAYSIFQWSQELLFQRTTREEKFVAKGFIDTFIFRLGTAASALSILAIGKLGDAGLLSPGTVVMAVLLLSSLVLFACAWHLGRRFQALGAATVATATGAPSGGTAVSTGATGATPAATSGTGSSDRT